MANEFLKGENRIGIKKITLCNVLDYTWRWYFVLHHTFIIHRQKTPSSSAVSKTGGKGEMNAVAVRQMPLNILPSVIF
ncbi:MAG: hypothetical protein WAM18_09480 [Halobacillus sp.]|uniref:hypothetical protein n=1 Tax=Halobacillus sp. TaxID=56800 RepID=UPI003BAE6030